MVALLANESIPKSMIQPPGKNTSVGFFNPSRVAA
jgi:hypothetical protein